LDVTSEFWNPPRLLTLQKIKKWQVEEFLKEI